MIYRCILAQWKKDEDPSLPKVIEGQFTIEELESLNIEGYNIYYLPNYPSDYNPEVTVTGAHIDRFEVVYVDMDLKDGTYASKEAFLEQLSNFPLAPTSVVDSGNGVHAFWRVTDLDAMSYLRLSRRLMRHLRTDEAVGQIFQLMRAPGTLNVKQPGEGIKICMELKSNDVEYTAEALSKALAPITHADEQHCQQHYNKTYNIGQQTAVDEKMPLKFAQLLDTNPEVKKIWLGGVDDRSKSDFRLAHIIFASGFTKAEAMSVLINCPKALSRAPIHRVGYAAGIVDQIWTFEITQDKTSLKLSSSVRDLISKGGNTLKGTRFYCHPYLDATVHGFRLGQVIGLIAGSGVGKTAMALNMFKGFVERNPEFDHFFIPLEQPAHEIADRWKTMVAGDDRLLDKVHVMSNYDDDTGSFRHLSLEEIKDYIKKFQEVTGKKIGSVVIDHIGALKKKGKAGENQDLMDICHSMKAFAIETNTMVVMQSQAPREKAGIGDLELNKDAAYGTVYFESYCDYVITIWQPLKRVYSEEGCPTVTAFKFCKIRHKKQGLDKIKEDVRYQLVFDPTTEHMRELTELEERAAEYWNIQATNARKKDRKTDVLSYTSTKTYMGVA